MPAGPKIQDTNLECEHVKMMKMQEYEEEFEDYSGSEAQLHFWYGLIWTDLELPPGMVERFWKCEEFDSLKSSCYWEPQGSEPRGSCMLLCDFEHFQ